MGTGPHKRSWKHRCWDPTGTPGLRPWQPHSAGLRWASACLWKSDRQGRPVARIQVTDALPHGAQRSAPEGAIHRTGSPLWWLINVTCVGVPVHIICLCPRSQSDVSPTTTVLSSNDSSLSLNPDYNPSPARHRVLVQLASNTSVLSSVKWGWRQEPSCGGLDP